MASNASRVGRGSGPVLLAVLLLLFSNLAVVRGQTGATLVHFPRFAAFADLDSGLAIVNPSGKDALAKLTLRDLNGNLFPIANNPINVSIPAKGQIAKTAAELFGTFLFIDASLEVSSSTPGLLVYYCTFDSGLTFMDCAEPPLSSINLIFPVIPGTNEGVSEIDLLNTNIRPTAVELKLWNFNGDLLGQSTVQVPAGGNYRNLARDAFPPGTSFSGASHITANSKPPNIFGQAQTVSGTSLFAGFSSVPSSDGDVDIAALNALTLTQASNSGVIPYFRTGSRHAATLSLANVETASIDVDLTALKNDGSTLGTRRISLRPNGGFRAPLQSVFSGLGFSEQEGWILVQAGGRVAATVIHGRNDTGSLSAIPMQRTPRLQFAFPQVVQGFGLFSEVTLTNPNSFSATAEVFVITPSGATLTGGKINLGPSRRSSLRLDQISPELEPVSGGFVFVRTSQPLFASMSLWTDSGSVVTTFTPGALPSSFAPAPQTSFAVTGKVTLNDRPAPGFRVVLSGPVSDVTTSQTDGAYYFRNLPAGKYSMTIDQFGFQFIPGQVNFEITNGSRQQDFQGFTAADAIVVQPSSVPVRSPAITATVFGIGFNSTSVAFAGPVRLQTTSEGSTQLKVLLPEYLFVAPNRFDIHVVTNESRPDQRVSRPYPIVAFIDRPELTSIVTAGNIVEGNPGTSIGLEGLGFLPGARVKVNGSSAGIEISLLNNTQIIAFLPASYLQRGGIYPVTVENPYPANVESRIQLLTVFYPAPAVQEIFPNVTPVKLEDGASLLNLDVFGFGFRRGAVVLVTDEEIPVITTYCESDAFCLATQLFAKVPANLLRSSGFMKIRVRNPDPSLGTSEAVYLLIEGLQPTITSVLAGSATLLNTPFTFSMPVVVNGTNFGPQTAARVYRPGDDPLPAFASGKVLSSTQLALSIDVTYPESLGDWIVEVANPQPGGGISSPAVFTLIEGNFAGNPFLISLAPQTVGVGGPSFILTVTGTNFQFRSQINFYSTPLVTTFISGTELRAEVPASLIRLAGRVPVSVTNPDNGGTSNRLYLDIR